MTRHELIDHIHRKTDGEHSRKLIAEVIEIAFEQMAQGLVDDGRLSIPGFGTFTIKDRAARMGRNPRTGDPVSIPARRVVGFRVAAGLKSQL